jgi:hypothetical protein
MFSSILDKVLTACLAVALLIGAGSLWYADHEHQKIAPLQLAVSNANTAAKQAAADRDAAILAANNAQVQAKAAQDAQQVAENSAAVAASAAKDAKSKLALAGKTPAIAKVLDTPLPPEVWNAINNEPGN